MATILFILSTVACCSDSEDIFGAAPIQKDIAALNSALEKLALNTEGALEKLDTIAEVCGKNPVALVIITQVLSFVLSRYFLVFYSSRFLFFIFLYVSHLFYRIIPLLMLNLLLLLLLCPPLTRAPSIAPMALTLMICSL